MPLINASGFLHLVRHYKTVWFEGRVGSGKTAFAMYLAHELIRNGHARHLVANIDTVWGDEPENIVLRDGRYLDTVFVLDEGGLILQRAADARIFLAGQRKINSYVFIPSVESPSRATTQLSVMRIANLYPVKIPVWIYRSILHTGSRQKISQKDTFIWWKPHQIYGIYDTEGFPLDDDAIGDFLMSHIDTISRKGKRSGNKKQSRIARKSASIGGFNEMDQIGGFVEALEEAAVTFSDAVSIPTEQQGRKNRKRRL